MADKKIIFLFLLLRENNLHRVLRLLLTEMVYRSCNCCYHNGSLYPDGARNITLEDGRNASCCGGELVLPLPGRSVWSQSPLLQRLSVVPFSGTMSPVAPHQAREDHHHHHHHHHRPVQSLRRVGRHVSMGRMTITTLWWRSSPS